MYKYVIILLYVSVQYVQVHCKPAVCDTAVCTGEL